MKIVLLGGNSPTNVLWLEAMEAMLKKKYGDVFVHRYLHWDTKYPLIDLDKELERLKKELGGIKQYVIVGKSAGALLTLKGVYEHELTPKACVFFGTAVLWGREEGFDVDRWLVDYSVPTLYVQKSKDPAISGENLRALLGQLRVKDYEMAIFEGSEHEYNEYEEIAFRIITFFKELGFFKQKRKEE